VTDIFIRAVAAEVKGHGAKYEDNLKSWEYENTKYAFLTDRKVSHSLFMYSGPIVISNLQHHRHAFYRGLVEREDTIDPEFDDDVSPSF